MPMDVTLRQLRAFLAVLETESFSEAARSMHLSQAALSGLIKELESRVGVRLLDRSTRSVAPSVVGEAFEPMARRPVLDLDEALAGLNPAEIDSAVEVVRRVHRAGTAIVIVEHLLRVVNQLATRVVVLDRGTVLADGEPFAVMSDPAVIRAYLGRSGARA